MIFGAKESEGEKEPIYMASLPCYEDENHKVRIPENIKRQGYFSTEQGHYFFRVTKEQYKKFYLFIKIILLHKKYFWCILLLEHF